MGVERDLMWNRLDLVGVCVPQDRIDFFNHNTYRWCRPFVFSFYSPNSTAGGGPNIIVAYHRDLRILDLQKGFSMKTRLKNHDCKGLGSLFIVILVLFDTLINKYLGYLKLT